MFNAKTKQMAIIKTQIEGIDAETLLSKFNGLNEKLNGIVETLKNPQEKVDELITRKEVCELLGISYPTLGRWSSKGIVKAYRIGKKIRFKRGEVMQALIDINETKAY